MSWSQSVLYSEVPLYLHFARFTIIPVLLGLSNVTKSALGRQNTDGLFTPLVFSVAGGVGPAANILYTRGWLLYYLRSKEGHTVSPSTGLRCRLNFSLL